MTLALQHNEAPAAAEASRAIQLNRLRLLGRRSRCRLRIGLGIFAAEPLDAASRVNKALLAGEERVASRADFHVNVALMGRTGLEVISAGAHNPHRVVFGMDLFLGHR